MSVHTFLTGVRGVLAPLVAFHAIHSLEMQTLGWVAAGLIVASILLLVPELKFGRLAPKAKALVEEVTD
jgi:hypothetical protein